MYVEQKSLAVLDQAVGVFEVGLALADGFDFGSAQRDAGFDLFDEEVVVAGAAIVSGVALAAGDGVARLGSFGGRLRGGDDGGGWSGADMSKIPRMLMLASA